MAVITFLSLGVTLPTYAASPTAINLLSSGNFAIIAKSGISTTGVTAITGSIGVSPIAATAITGFGLIMDSSNTFSNSTLVTGKIYAGDYTAPTPTLMTTAVGDMQTAYTDGAGRTNPTATELGAGNIGGLTIPPGLYKWGTAVIIPSDVTLSGSSTDVWIFQIAQTLSVSSGVHIILSGGAQAGNIFWVVGGQTTIGTTAIFNGTILDQTAIVLNTGAQLNGRALAQTAVTLDANTVTISSTPSSAPVQPTPTPTPTLPPVITSPSIPTPTTNNSSQTIPTTSQQFSNNKASADLLVNEIPLATNNTIIFPPSVKYDEPVLSVTTNLTQGMKNIDVLKLQYFLIAQNIGSAAKNLAHVGATSYFGVLTRAALAEFQAYWGITPAWGNFGPITRNFLFTNFK